MTQQSDGSFRIIGRSLTRSDAEDKVRGKAQYLDDLTMPGVWYADVVRAPVPCGKLLGLHFDESFDWTQVVTVKPEDIPGENIVDMTGLDMPFLAYDRIQYQGEPLALIAAPSKALAREAVNHVRAEVEELPAIQSIQEMVERHKTGLADSLRLLEKKEIRRGDAEGVLAGAGKVLEGEYWTGFQEQLYIEPQGMAAEPMESGGVYIRGSIQCPYYVAPELMKVLNLPLEKIRVEQTVTGGAFGGKEEFPTLPGGYCALLALKAGRPVKMVYDRHEDILFTTKRHPSWTRYRTALAEDGRIAAMEVDMILDGGAYTTISPVVLYRGILHAALGYRCENVTVRGFVYASNSFPCGAFRGFGAPQAYWGLESHVEDLAEQAGLGPDEFRLKNCLQEGDITPTGQHLLTSVGTPAVLKEALRRSDFHAKLARCDQGRPGAKSWYGIGVSFFAHGAGFTGDGEAKFGSRAAMELGRLSDGRPGLTLYASSTEMGQGAKTVLAQMAAEGAGLPFDRVFYPLPDTRVVPDSGPTVASRTTMVVGNILYHAGHKMKCLLEEAAAKHCFGGASVRLEGGRFFAEGVEARPFEEVAEVLLAQGEPLRTEHQFALPPHIRWDQERFVGDAYPAYSWACNVAEVEVDPLTLQIHLRKITAVYDVGRIINPTLAIGQLQGGLVQTIGYALMETMQVRKGLYDANRLQTYIIPTALDVPEMDLQFLEYSCDELAPGAKGLGEITMNGLAPAIGNAVRRATGCRLCAIPMRPEDLYATLYQGAKD
ncbi:MAG: xanthine dehydrogenase family protein molybdopterin-binding subunit [Kiritimatiellae bacterium]|nr:xanthine dehydrogenase family protein molybdopterin-binding subunit [Kiritimatiellia bacterium]